MFKDVPLGDGAEIELRLVCNHSRFLFFYPQESAILIKNQKRHGQGSKNETEDPGFVSVGNARHVLWSIH